MKIAYNPPSGNQITTLDPYQDDVLFDEHGKKIYSHGIQLSGFKASQQELDVNVVKTFQLTSNYQPTGVVPSESGTYLIELSIEDGNGNLRNASPFYSCRLVGFMSWYKEPNPTPNLGAVESLDEILLHRSGRKYDATLYLATETQTDGQMKLLIAASDTIEGTTYVRFKLKRLI